VVPFLNITQQGISFHTQDRGVSVRHAAGQIFSHFDLSLTEFFPLHYNWEKIYKNFRQTQKIYCV